MRMRRWSETGPHPVQVVNLLVTPEQAEKLTLASSQTRIQLVLRNPLDTQTANPPGSMMSELFRTSAVRPPSAPGPALGGKPRAVRGERADGSSPLRPARTAEIQPRKIRIVEVFNGTAKTEVTFTVREDPK